ncbi:MAG: thiamine pyrophosphate-binding protein [Chloroflexi bacterium]|nr:thiamine pyrophosphate-binding protein [Chloroflexota bacterium]MCI0862438.1 thiamine pyrophosphate-binding protein [Chloroflexota bacterium]MCI0877047.1 thiamine pyrophosphate-binding protein [Chloroflexota bacterium]
MPSVADLLVERLAEANIDNVFGLPGGETVEILDSIRRSGVGFTLVHRECSAAFMASATARLTGRPSACLTTLGPGATNVVTGVAHAALDRTPVIVITAQTPERMLPGHTHQVLDLGALFGPLTKASFHVQPDGADETICEAITLATTGRPGPVHLQISNDVAAQQATKLEARSAPPGSTAVATDSLQVALQILSESKRPILIAGLGLEPEGPYEEVLHLAEATHAPVIVTPKAKGAVPDDHPLSPGTIGLTWTDPVYEVLDQADCVVAVGFDVVELVKPWDHPAPLIWLASWANQDPEMPAAAELIGTMGPALRRLAEADSHAEEGWGETIVAAHRRKHPRLQSMSSPPELLAPQAVLRVLREHVGREALITTDVGSHKILACLEWPAFVPNRFLVSNGLSSMGYSLSAAIAAGLILRDTPVVCTTGDAGLLMSMSELSTLARLQVPVTVVVFKDHALDLIRSQQKRAGKPAFATEFTAPDFVRIAEAHGIPAARVSSEETLTEAVKRFVESRKPALIEVAIDPSTYPTTPTGN